MSAEPSVWELVTTAPVICSGCGERTDVYFRHESADHVNPLAQCLICEDCAHDLALLYLQVKALVGAIP